MGTDRWLTGTCLHRLGNLQDMVDIYPYQIKTLDDMQKYKGRGMVQFTGRSGKSHWTNMAIKRLMEDLAHRPIEDMILSEGTVYGARYYCVEPIGGHWMDMEVWCLDTFGATSSIWHETKNLTPEPLQRWYMNNRKFWFREQKDRDWFILKW